MPAVDTLECVDIATGALTGVPMGGPEVEGTREGEARDEGAGSPGKGKRQGQGRERGLPAMPQGKIQGLLLGVVGRRGQRRRQSLLQALHGLGLGTECLRRLRGGAWGGQGGRGCRGPALVRGEGEREGEWGDGEEGAERDEGARGAPGAPSLEPVMRLVSHWSAEDWMTIRVWCGELLEVRPQCTKPLSFHLLSWTLLCEPCCPPPVNCPVLRSPCDFPCASNRVTPLACSLCAQPGAGDGPAAQRQSGHPPPAPLHGSGLGTP